MRYLFDQIGKIKNRYDSGESLLIAAHFDGVLVPCSDGPYEIVVKEELKSLLRSVVSKNKVSLAVFSGRPLDLLKISIDIDDIYYVGNYGLEIESPAMRFVSPKAKKIFPMIQDIKNKIVPQFESNKHILVENKMIAFSIHCSQKNKDVMALVNEVERIVSRYIDPKEEIAVVKRGAEIEVCPRISLDSGDALNWIFKNLTCSEPVLFPLIFMNPLADGHACEIVNEKKGISAVIGQDNVNTGAQFYLKKQEEVSKFLNQLINW